MKPIIASSNHILTFVTAATLVGMLSVAPTAEAKGKVDPQPLGGTVACMGFYLEGQPNTTNWKFSNFNNASISIERIRVYKSDGVLYSDNQWTSTGEGFDFVDFQGMTTYFPYDGNGNLGPEDNELEAYQSFIYHSNTLLDAGMLPLSPNDGNVSFFIDWSAETPVYPLAGAVIRHKGSPTGDFLGRSTGGCHLIERY